MKIYKLSSNVPADMIIRLGDVIGPIDPYGCEQKNNDAWKKFGEEMGFYWRSVRFIVGGDYNIFMAQPLKGQEKEEKNETE